MTEGDKKSTKGTSKDVLERDIFDILGNANLSEEKKVEVYKKMLETIRFRALDRIHNTLTDEDIEEWKKLVEKSDEVGIAKLMNEKGIDIPKIMLEETIRYKIEVNALMERIRKSGKSYQEIEREIEEFDKAKADNINKDKNA